MVIPERVAALLADDGRKLPEDQRRYYGIGGMTLTVESDLPITDNTFHQKFEPFRQDGPGADGVIIRHRFQRPALDDLKPDQCLYRRPPWAIYQAGDCYVYLEDVPDGAPPRGAVMVGDRDYRTLRIYHNGDTVFRAGGLQALTLSPTDQILLAPLLAERSGCFFHSSGLVLNGGGLLFVGHSEAGKSTTAKMLKAHGTILCDDRVILRRIEDGFRIFGTWSHGELPDISPMSAPLKAILFLEKSDSDNRLIPITDRRDVRKRLLECLVKPLWTRQWWDQIFNLLFSIETDVPCYRLRFDKSGRIVQPLMDLAAG